MSGCGRTPGGRGPKLHYTREQALRFPLGVDCHDTGLRYLFDFTVAVRALDLRPGARVLDFASGSSFGSELLNRFGYVTVACDLDPGVLRYGRERLGLDLRCEAGDAGFVAGDGQCLPFANASFDGVLCMNALHHMPDYGATLAEMHRVLRPGGRASFSEPGSEHSRSPESVAVMRQYGVVEKDVVLSEIDALAREIGFARMWIKPFVYPEHVALDYAEFAAYKRGERVTAPLLRAQEIGETVERSHALFCLVKAGEREKTSATEPPTALRARIHAIDLPAEVRLGEALALRAECENTGDCTWLARPRRVGGFVTFGVRILDEEGRLLEDLEGRRTLPRDVRPGERVEIVSEVRFEPLGPGRYRVVLDMVDERVAWFGDVGSSATEWEVQVLA